jgi:hypothetical protein
VSLLCFEASQLGNDLDRVLFGWVRDINWSFGNLADLYTGAGFLFMAIELISNPEITSQRLLHFFFSWGHAKEDFREVTTFVKNEVCCRFGKLAADENKGED